MDENQNHPTHIVRGREETCDGPSVRGSTPTRVSCRGGSVKMLWLGFKGRLHVSFHDDLGLQNLRTTSKNSHGSNMLTFPCLR